jgi:hypothetical protein
VAEFPLNGKRNAWQWATEALYVIARYYSAFTLLSYGFAKIMGAQFTIIESQLDMPMGKVSGFWLTWYYFGLSPAYGAIVAGAQIGGAVLLCFRRTALLGALVLLPVMLNIAAIDYWVIHFPLAAGPLRIALCVLAALLVILFFHRKELIGLLPRPRDGSRPWIIAGQAVIVVAMTAYTARERYWLANFNNRDPTPIDGTWRVVQTEPSTADVPGKFYFEYNRAYMCVFKLPNGRTETNDFRVNTQKQTLTISAQWLAAGSEIFNGIWRRQDDNLTLTGLWRNSNPLVIRLQRERMPVKDHQ